ncbi:MAG: ABC transporter ATP-binding protein, partial [Candidatus Sericytochromatia bacterium]|nr:ABC transporter ATP-binding protein [Candidatus Sericytochromatia bacterium]
MKLIIEATGLNKTYKIADNIIHALDNVSFSISEGEMVAITGPSGSGKSTLMNVIGCLDKVDQGKYILADNDVSKLSDDKLAEIRNKFIGFVFQTFNLLPRMSALENVELPLLYAGKTDTKPASIKALQSVGLAERMYHQPNQLSGGQKQRVSIARAMVTNPAIILADEPTGALDSKTSVEIMALFQELNKSGRTIIIVTHEQEIADYCPRQIKMK